MTSRVLLLYIVCTCLLPLKAQEVTFRHLTVEDGLSQSTINCIYQDHYGFMWFGTQDGLNCYDGFKFTTYRSVPEDSSTLSHNWIWDLVEDDENNLWIATWQGLTKYNRSTRSFSRFLPDSTKLSSISGTRPASLVRDSSGHIWIGIWGGGVNVLDPETGTFTLYRKTEDPDHNYPGNFIRKLYLDREGTIWIGSWNGLWRCRSGSDGLPKFKHYSIDPDDPTSIGSMRITSFCEDQEGRLWVGTLGGGLNMFDPAVEGFKRFQHDPDDVASLSSNDITSMELLADGSLWIATVSKGLNRFDPETESFTRFSNDPSDQGSIASDNVYCVFVDQGGVLWVGAGGLNIFNPGLLRFAPGGRFEALKQELEGHPVYAIYEDRNGFVWVGTLASGVARLEPERGEVNWYRHFQDRSNSISSNSVSAITEDAEGNIWISTNGGGLNRLDPDSGRLESFQGK